MAQLSRASLEDALIMLEHLLDRDASEAEIALLDQALASGAELVLALNNIVDVADEVVVHRMTFIPRDLVQDVAAASMRRSRSREIEVVVLCDEALGQPILGDARLLRRILANVLDNAMRYNEPGGEVLVSATAQDRSDRERRITLDIADTGHGITGPVMTGLLAENPERGHGLRCVRKIVTAMGGEIAIDSTEGDGTSVCIGLPFERIDGAEEESWSFAGLEALIIEDGGTARMSLEFELDRLQCRFKSSADPDALSDLAIAARVVFAKAALLVDEDFRGRLEAAGGIVALCRDSYDLRCMGLLGIATLELPIRRRELATLLGEFV